MISRHAVAAALAVFGAAASLLSVFLSAQQAGVDPNPPNPAVDARNQGGLLDVALDPQ